MKAARFILTRRRAFTLVEMVVALAVVAVLLIGAQSAVMVAARAVPDAKAPNAMLVREAAGLERMMGELAYAKTLVTASAARVVFTVADRTGDGADETIEYSWAGSKGAAVVRVMNGGTPESVVSSAEGLTFSYDCVDVADPTALVTGAETTLGSYAGLGLGTTALTSSTLLGAVFTPAMPANAVRFTVTRAAIKLRQNGAATGTTLVQVRTAWNDRPTTKIVDQAAVLESALSTSYASIAVVFAGNAAIAAGSPIALVVQCGANANSCDVQTATLAVSLSGYTCATSTDTGVSWSSSGLKQLIFTVYGTVTTLDPTATVTRCTNVRCALSGAGGRGRLSSGVHLFNEPRMP